MEKSNHFDPHDIFLKLQRNEITPKEKQQLDTWLSSAPENEKTWQQMLSIWEATDYAHVPKDESLHTQWHRLQRRLNLTEEQQAQTFVQPGQRFYNHKSLALGFAVFAVAIIALFILFKVSAPFFSAQQMDVTAPYGKIVNIELPDGSHAELNAGTQLRFPKSFSDASREVYLKGEAFFNVKHGEIPFIIHTGNATTTVLGTSFNIQFWDTVTEVFVVTGRVSLQSNSEPAENEIILTKGQLGKCLNNPKHIYNLVTMDDILAWRKQHLVFRKQPLADVLAEIERFFNVSIRVDASLYHHTITASFTDESLTTILQTISASINVEVRQTATGYELHKKKI